MKGKDISDALGGVDGRYIEESANSDKKKVRWIRWAAPAAAVLVIALALGLFFGGGKTPYQPKPSTVTDLSGEQEAGQPKTFAVTEVVYPAMAKYPDQTNRSETDAWYQSRRERAAYFSYCEGLEPFIIETIPEFLCEKEGENALYSPLNVYMALAMLAEISGGETRRQVLDLLGADTVESLRIKAKGVWNACYYDDGATVSIPAASVWLDERISADTNTLKRLSESNYASAYKGDMQDAAFTAAFQAWLNEQTGNLLKDQIDRIGFSPETILSLATTLYFRARWSNTFDSKNNTVDTFHGSVGNEQCEFMHRPLSARYCWGDAFSACRCDLDQNGGMWFILPDEGVTAEDLLRDEEVLWFIADPDGWENIRHPIVNLSVPKFDVCYDTDLSGGLARLGVTDCFNLSQADFTPLLSDDTPAAVNEVKHGVRVAIDEEGVKAAAYTVMTLYGATPPDEIVDFTVDRPFIFVITGNSGMPLFVGIVNQV